MLQRYFMFICFIKKPTSIKIWLPILIIVYFAIYIFKYQLIYTNYYQTHGLELDQGGQHTAPKQKIITRDVFLSCNAFITHP